MPGVMGSSKWSGCAKTVQSGSKTLSSRHTGSSIFLQLWHCGRASHPDFHGGEKHVAPSEVKIEGDHIHTPDGKKPHEVPQPLKTDEIPGIVDDYREAAVRAKAAGFDGVEVHSANGCLLDTFLQSNAGRVCRDDQGWLLFNFYTPAGPDRTAHNLMPPPKRLRRLPCGQLIAQSFEGILHSECDHA